MRPLLALLCCLFAGIIAAEMSPGADPGHPDGPSVKTVNAPTQVLQKTAPSEHFPQQWEALILARPLFAPDRRPAAGFVTADAGLPRLTGIIAFPGHAVAIFQPAGIDKPMAVRHGETVSGWEVTRITGNDVSLQKAADRLTLRPQFGNVTTGSPAAEAKPPPSRWETAAASGMLRARWSNPQLQP